MIEGNSIYSEMVEREEEILKEAVFNDEVEGVAIARDMSFETNETMTMNLSWVYKKLSPEEKFLNDEDQQFRADLHKEFREELDSSNITLTVFDTENKYREEVRELIKNA